MTTFCLDVMYGSFWISKSLLVNLINMFTTKQISDGNVVLSYSRAFSDCLWAHLAILRVLKVMMSGVLVSGILVLLKIRVLGVLDLLELCMLGVFVLEMLVLEIFIILVLSSTWEYTCNYPESWK